MTEITGLDHVTLSVSDLARAEASRGRAMALLGLRKNRFTAGGGAHGQYFDRHFGLVIRPARGAARHDP